MAPCQFFGAVVELVVLGEEIFHQQFCVVAGRTQGWEEGDSGHGRVGHPDPGPFQVLFGGWDDDSFPVVDFDMRAWSDDVVGAVALRPVDV